MIALNILVVNGRKINSFALAFECLTNYSNHDNYVRLVDLDIVKLPFLKKTRVSKKILKQLNVTLASKSFYKSFKNYCRAAKIASEWYKKALLSENPWEENAIGEEIPVGLLVKSLIARSMGSANFEIKDCPPLHVYEIAQTTIFSYFQTLEAIDLFGEDLELGFAHGGRDAFSAGAITAFKKLNIPFRLLEAGGVPSRWSEFKISPHYSPEFWNRMALASEKVDNQSLIDNWWQIRLKGSDHFRSEEWGSTRVPKLLPMGLPKKFVSFFTTSDFEIPIFKEFDYQIGTFKNQFEALTELHRLTRLNNIHLVIRRHPNSVDSSGKDREISLWKTFKNLPGVTYIEPHEKIDSIALAQASQKVFTFKSSVGIESLWLGVPAYALGPARWAWTDELRAWNSDKISQILKENSYIDKVHPIRWANMMTNMDYECKKFESIHGNFAIYRGVKIKNVNLANFIEKILIRIINFIYKQ